MAPEAPPRAAGARILRCLAWALCAGELQGAAGSRAPSKSWQLGLVHSHVPKSSALLQQETQDGMAAGVPTHEPQQHGPDIIGAGIPMNISGWGGNLAMSKFAGMGNPADIVSGGSEGDIAARRKANIELTRLSVVRIHAISTPVDWMRPYINQPPLESVGSGFAIEPVPGFSSDEDPLFLTSAHIVSNAHEVSIELPAVGRTDYMAYVPLICHKYDLALVRLLKPAEFVKKLAEQKAKLHVLKVGWPTVSLGLKVEAVGFPLDSLSLKISRGEIAGTEQEQGKAVYQSTAPVSFGSEGGPLFSLGEGEEDEDELELIGVNYKSSARGKAQNVNYVIPIMHIHQILAEHGRAKAEEGQTRRQAERVLGRIQDQMRAANLTNASAGTVELIMVNGSNASPEADPAGPGLQMLAATVPGAGGRDPGPDARLGDVLSLKGITQEELQQLKAAQAPRPHKSLGIAPLGVMGVEGSEALYKSSGNCRTGFYITKILNRSALRWAATPKVPELSFITAVNGVPIDPYGMGRRADFLSDPLPFEAMLGFGADVEEPVTITTCLAGKETNHTVSLRWDSSLYDPGVKQIAEPLYAKDPWDYEFFADATIMQMTVNHIAALVPSSPTLGRWLLPEAQGRPRLIITDVGQGKYTSRNLAPGMVIESINGHDVSTLDEYRQHFEPQNGSHFWTLKTSRGLLLEAQFEKILLKQAAMSRQAKRYHHMLSPAVARVLQSYAAKKVAGGLEPMPGVPQHIQGQHGWLGNAVPDGQAAFPLSAADIENLAFTPGLDTGSGGSLGEGVRVTGADRGEAEAEDELEALPAQAA
eukprot:CAMPEP_0168376182 /NCGR_PEP_ID=MMETSP0228-20121227/10189_1 /TAXON_ID=133427 /ORGANISM="Protoceratium reticulatum, Strain CCCM 535 (=CCMP 1889)" /LENGTH=815 /DNA_ID=CAMNT_0008389161 /DNA_START=81 /DNA_END=2525 /DNA_ORIENTATION=-